MPQALSTSNQKLEAKVAERTTALQQKSLELEAVLNALPDLYFRFDVQGTYLDIHAPPGALFQPTDQLLGRRIHELFPPDTARRFNETISEVIRTKSFRNMEYQFDLPDGTIPLL